MNREWFSRLIQAAVISLTLAAICQELEKPAEERKWHGKVAGAVPYDFRLPTIEKFKEAYWNPYESRIFSPVVFGVGWAVNLYALLDDLGLIKPTVVSEEDFLMPTESIKQVMKEALEIK